MSKNVGLRGFQVLRLPNQANRLNFGPLQRKAAGFPRFGCFDGFFRATPGENGVLAASLWATRAI